MNKPMILKWQEEKKKLSNLGISIITSLQDNDMNSYGKDVGGSRKHQQMYSSKYTDPVHKTLEGY